MGSKASRADILAAFQTDEGFKAVAARLGMSPNTLRGIWKDAFGEEAFTERGKKLQAQAAAKTCRETAATRTYKDVRVPCSECQTPVPLKANQVAQMDLASFVCNDCKYDRTCPVCDLLVDGERGLSGHFRHRREAGDQAHLEYQEAQVEVRWVGKAEGAEYVVCRICGHRAETLARHLKAAHGITAEQYRAQFSDARIRSEKVEQARREALTISRVSPAYEGTKSIVCPSCGSPREVSKFLVPGMHDLRCDACQAKENTTAEVARWAGKAEPVDFVECRVCGWKGENITGHLLADHPGVNYRAKYPEAPLFADGVMCYPTHKRNLTEQDLTPFKDSKGRVQVALAADVLGCCGLTVLRYCKELNLPTRNRLAFQKQVLDAVNEILGGQGYEWEWSDERITNPVTGYRLFFDGYFAGLNLLVEVQGKQHYVYIPYWHKTREVFAAMQTRDAAKQQQALALGFRMLTIRYDEPYTDVSYLRGRLRERGLV